MSIKTEMVTRTETYKAVIYICDACGEKISSNPPRACEICSRHFHRECDPYDHSEYSGDYSVVTCGNCWKTGEPYREKIKELEKEEEEALAEWGRVARAAASKTHAGQTATDKAGELVDRRRPD